MALQRSLYSTQFLKLRITGTTANPQASSYITGLPVQTASIERTVPTEDIVVLGRLGSVGRQQKEVETYKMDIKLFWASTSGAQLTAGDIIALTGNALKGTPSEVIIEPNGFTGFGILNKFSLDGSVGNFITADLGFEGFGTPIISTAANAGSSEGGGVPTTVTVYTSENVILGGNNSANTSPTETIKSAKFNLDLPTETLSRIGAPITGSTTGSGMTGNYLHVAKPPFKASFSYEGELVTGDHKSDALQFGHLVVSGINFNVTSQSFSQNQGDVGATMSFNSEGVSVVFTTG